MIRWVAGTAAAAVLADRRADDDPTAAPRLRILAGGELEDAEHATSGTAYVVETAAGDRVLRCDGLTTPDDLDLA